MAGIRQEWSLSWARHYMKVEYVERLSNGGGAPSSRLRPVPLRETLDGFLDIRGGDREAEAKIGYSSYTWCSSGISTRLLPRHAAKLRMVDSSP